MKQNALFIIGAQRSGSTFLYHLLDEHPEISLVKPVRPEPKTFLDEYSSIASLGEYATRYSASFTLGAKYIGEKSTSYFESVKVAKRIQACCPDAKILVILRDPVARAYSNYRFSVENGIENLPFGDALAVETVRLEQANYESSVNPYAYRTRGEYARYLAAYLTVFPKNAIKACILEEFSRRRSGLIDVYRWLGVDPDFSPKTSNSIVNASAEMDQIDPDVRRWLIKQYAKPIGELEEILGRTVEVWRNVWNK